MQFALVRCYRNAGGGIPDTSCPATIQNALEAGIQSIGVYLFPVMSKPASQQVAEALSPLQGLPLNCLWLDVETSGGTAWSTTDPQPNIVFIREFALAAFDRGITAGIYCGTAGWQTLTGNTTEFSELPLWWSSHGAAFSPFGGWPAPFVTQFAYDVTVDGINLDRDVMMATLPL